MKKILTLFIVACMLLSVIPMSVSAESINHDTTLYISISGNDSTGDGSYENPYATMEKAYGEVLQTGGKIVVKSDGANAFNSHTATQKIMPACAGTVYVYGIPDNNGDYPTLDFSRTSSTGATVFNLGCSMVFYNLDITNNGGNLWFSAAFHELTFGYGITMSMPSGKVSVTGGYHSNGITANHATDRECNINIYSGVFGDCYLGHFADMSSKGEAYIVKEASVFNFIGGTAANIYVFRHDENGYKCYKADATINMYGGTVTGAIAVRPELIKKNNKSATLNLYNGNEPTTIGDAFKHESIGGTLNRLTCDHIPAPEYIVSYSGVQNTGINTDTTDDIPDNTYSVRFVAVMGQDYTAYSKAGFKIMVGGIDQGGDCNNVYTSIAAEGTDDYTAAELGGEYIFAYTLRKIPVSSGTVTFTVTPYVYIGETQYFGAAYTVVYNAGTFVSSTPAN